MSWSNLRYLPGQIGLALLIFGLWEGLVRAEVLSAHLYGYPSGIAAKVWGLLSTGELFKHAGVTAFAAILGFVLGSAIGSFAGLCLWLNETVAKIVRPFIVAINGVPKIAFAPLIIVWFGIGIESKIAIAAALTFIVSLIATYNGTLETDRDLLRLMRSLGATRLQAWRKVVIPAALPWMLSTLRLNRANRCGRWRIHLVPRGSGVSGLLFRCSLRSQRGLGRYPCLDGCSSADGPRRDRT